MTITENKIIDRITIDPTWQPGNFYKVVSETKINQVGRIHADFFNTIYKSDDEVVLMPIAIAGAVHHPSLLLRKLSHTPAFHSIKDYIEIDVMSYHSEVQSNLTEITQSPKLAEIIHGRHIALIDVMFDSGNTVNQLLNFLPQFDIIDITVFIVVSKHTPDQINQRFSHLPHFRDISPLIITPEKLWLRGWGLDNDRKLFHIEGKIPLQK